MTRLKFYLEKAIDNSGIHLIEDEGGFRDHGDCDELIATFYSTERAQTACDLLNSQVKWIETDSKYNIWEWVWEDENKI